MYLRCQKNLEDIFFGIDLIGGFNFTPKWSTELNLKSYISNSNFYLFPSLDFKFSQQLGKLPVKINPSVGVGSDLIFLNKKVQGARYIFYSPGLELEFGLGKRISIFAKGKYHFLSHFYDKQYTFDKLKCLDLTYGIRFNIR